jgi:hypothetical protein
MRPDPLTKPDADYSSSQALETITPEPVLL